MSSLWDFGLAWGFSYLGLAFQAGLFGLHRGLVWEKLGVDCLSSRRQPPYGKKREAPQLIRGADAPRKPRR